VSRKKVDEIHHKKELGFCGGYCTKSNVIAQKAA